MSRPARIKTKRLSYYPEGPDKDGIYSGPLRKHALKTADGRIVKPRRIIEDLVNLPGNPESHEIEVFIGRYHNLLLGGVDDSRRGAVEQMTPAQVIGLRERFRKFWILPDGLKSESFLTMLQPQSVAKVPRIAPGIKKLKSGALEGSEEQLSALGALGTPFPYLLYGRSALRLDWRTGRFWFIERGNLDRLTLTVFENRDRLRKCRYPRCTEAISGGQKLFIAAKPNEFFCCSNCRAESDRERKKQSASERRTRLRVDGLTSRKTKPKRKITLRP